MKNTGKNQVRKRSIVYSENKTGNMFFKALNSIILILNCKVNRIKRYPRGTYISEHSS